MLPDASSVFQPKKNGSMRHEEEIKAKGSNFSEYLNLTPDRNTETYALAYYNLAYIAFHEKDYTLAQNRFLKFTQLEKGENPTALADAYNRIGDCHLHVRTEILLFMIGIPSSFSICSPTSTSLAAFAVIFL